MATLYLLSQQSNLDLLRTKSIQCYFFFIKIYCFFTFDLAQNEGKFFNLRIRL